MQPLQKKISTTWKDSTIEYFKSLNNKKLLPLLVIILLNALLILIFGSFIVYRAIYLETIPEPVSISLPPPPVVPPPAPPVSTDTGGVSNSPLDPDPIVVPPPATPTAAILSKSVQADFSAAELANKSLNITLRNPKGSTPSSENSAGTGTKVGNVNFFGNTESNGVPLMTGYLYDLKQTASRKPTNITRQDYRKELSNFVKKNWDQTVLDKYYKFPKPLYTPQIFIPNINADLGPQQFKAQNEVLPRLWVAYYTVTVSLPEDGTYKFYGSCDDILLVRVRDTTVLDGSLSSVAGMTGKAYKWDLLGDEGKGMSGSLKEGIPFHISAGVPTKIDIMIGEEPGGWFNAFLLVGKASGKYETGHNGMPILPVFQVAPSPIPGTGIRPVSAPPMVWTAVDTTPPSSL